MRNKQICWTFRTVACAAGLILSAAGCGEAPFAPPLQGSSAGAGADLPVLAVALDGSVAYDSVGTGARLDSLLAETPYSAASRALKVTGEIGPEGGVLRAGRFVLTFSPDALHEKATVTMSLPDSTVMLCDLDISPGYLNAFTGPVELSLDTRGLAVNPTELSIYWYDPAEKRWVDMHATSDLLSETVEQPLSHFSTYAGGKAGW
jgi:hypothetical protein